MVAFYKISLVGLKLEHYESVSWSIGGRRSVSAAEIQPGTRVAIHPCFWRTLGVREEVLSTPATDGVPALGAPPVSTSSSLHNRG